MQTSTDAIIARVSFMPPRSHRGRFRQLSGARPCAVTPRAIARMAMAQKSHEPTIGDGSLHVGDRVVYPNQGNCRITGVSTKQISGQNCEVVTLSREEDGATVMVPKAKVMGVGLRKVADVAAIDKVFDELTARGNDPQLDWKVRHRENAERMSGGGLFGTVEVLRSLHTLSRVRP